MADALPPVRPEVIARFSPRWQVRILAVPEGGVAEKLPEPFVCGACAAADVDPVGWGAHGALAGGDVWYEVRCRSCATVTEYRHEWG